MTKTETITDILREMRDEMTGCRFVRGEGIDSLHAAQEELSKFADRIEAALAEANGGING